MAKGRRRSYFAYRDDFSSTKWSYRKVFDLAVRFSSLLEECGIDKGDRVVIRGDNSLPLLVAFLGAINRGAVLVPLDGTIAQNAADRIIEKVQAKIVVSTRDNRKSSGNYPLIELETLEAKLASYPVKPIGSPVIYEDDLAEIVFTSGTMSEPKGVMIRHSNITSLFPPIMEIIASLRPVLKILRNINFLALLPLSHLYGQMAEIFIPIMLQGSVVFPCKLSSSFLLETIKKEKIIVAICVPRILEIMRSHIINDINHSGKGETFRKKYERVANWHFVFRFLYFLGFHRRAGLTFLAMVVGGAKLDHEVYEFYRRLSFAVYQGYGLTETSPIVTIFNPLRDEKGSVGKIAGDQQIRIAGDGEILVRGSNVSEGYFEDQGSAETVFQEGWLHTGDIGNVDREGNLYFLGRKKDVIVTSDGLNVYPEDIENVLNSLDGVKDSAVIGIGKDDSEEIMAVLLVEPGIDPKKDIIRKANAILSPPQRIKYFRVWPETDFPRTSSLKIKKREVAEKISSLKTDVQTPPKSGLADTIFRLTHVDVGTINPSLKLGSDLGLTSLDRLELALSLENDYQISIQDFLLDEETSIKDLEDILSGREVREKEISMPRFSNNPVFTFIRFVVWHIMFFPILRIFCRPRVSGLENLRGIDPPVIFIANHSSHLDTPVILSALPHRFRSRISPAMGIDVFKEYFLPGNHHPFMRLLHFWGYMALAVFVHVYPFSPASFRRSFAYTGELIENNYCPLIFPEGQRTKTGETGPFREGIGHLAIGIRVPVVPIRLRGTFELMPPASSFPKRGDVSVHIGKPYLSEGDDPGIIANKLQEIIARNN
jgi:long-chain acyl-CoA synthetase